MPRLVCFGLFTLAVVISAFGCSDGSSEAAKTTEKLTPKKDVAKEFAQAKSANDQKEEKVVTLESGVKYIDLEEGTGPVAKQGKKVEVHYTGWLRDGTMFDSSYTSARPLPVVIGAHSVIRGWELGLEGMKQGGKRKLLIPPALAYGAKGRPPKIPADAELVFEILLLHVD